MILDKLESATARLEAVVPDNLPAAEEALETREQAIAQIAALRAGAEELDRLRALWARGEEAVRHLRLLRAQLSVELSNVEQQRLLLRALGAGESHGGQVDWSA